MRALIAALLVGVFTVFCVGCNSSNSKEKVLTDGTKLYIFPDGQFKEEHPDGTVEYYRGSSDGTRIYRLSDGGQEFRHKDGSVKRFHDGQLTYQLTPEADGGKVVERWEKPNEVRLIRRTVETYGTEGLKHVTYHHHGGGITEQSFSPTTGNILDNWTNYGNGEHLRVNYSADGQPSMVEWIYRDGSGQRLTLGPNRIAESVEDFSSDAAGQHRIAISLKDLSRTKSDTTRVLRERPDRVSVTSSSGPAKDRMDTWLREDGTKEYRQTWYTILMQRPDEAHFPTVLGCLEEFDRAGTTVVRKVTFRMENLLALPVVAEIETPMGSDGSVRVRTYNRAQLCTTDEIVSATGTRTKPDTLHSDVGKMAPAIPLSKLVGVGETEPGNIDSFVATGYFVPHLPE